MAEYSNININLLHACSFRRFILFFSYFCCCFLVFFLGPPPPSIISTTSDGPNRLIVSWTPHCNSISACNSFGIKKEPTFYTIKYTSTDSSEVFAVESRNDDGSSFPNTVKTLNDLQSNTQYSISVSTNTYTTDGKTVNSDLSQESFEYTG